MFERVVRPHVVKMFRGKIRFLKRAAKNVKTFVTSELGGWLANFNSKHESHPRDRIFSKNQPLPQPRSSMVPGPQSKTRIFRSRLVP